MSLFSLIAVLLLEQFRPLPQRVYLYSLFTRYAQYLERHVNAGQYRHGVIAWLLAVLPPVLLVAGVHALLHHLHPVLAWLWNVWVLYLVLGFKPFSNNAASIAAALGSNDLGRARALLSQWQERPADELEANEVARLAIEQTLLCAHRHLFGLIAWFVVLGPGGAVLYRLAQLLGSKWGGLDEQEFGVFGRFAARVFELMDWLPVRLTAISFAIVGDFEDTVYCWRTQAAAWLPPRFGILLASGAGALGVKIGDSLHVAGQLEVRPELGLGDDADADYIQSAVSLVWRSLMLWLALLALLTLTNWMGG